MNYVYLIIITVTLLSCNNYRNDFDRNIHQELRKEFTVFKIDSIGSFYVIYLKKGRHNYKVISEIEMKKKSNFIIEVGQSYDLTLISIFNQTIRINDKEMRAYPLMVNCVSFEDNFNICIEEKLGINDLHYSPNLNGLYLINGNGSY